MNILGISCYYHDSAACLVKDGQIVAAVQEERLNRVKNSAAFPLNAINYCVQAGGITFQDIDYVAFYEKPYLKFHRMLINHIRSFPFSFPNFLRTMPDWLNDRLILPLTLKNELTYEGKTLFVKHHMAHAASAFFVSPFEEAAILTADGVGEWATLSIGHGKGNDIKILKEIVYPDSLGLIYTAVTTFLGFKANSGEGTTMGLAAYGKPTYLDQFREIVDVKEDGSFKVDQNYFGFNTGSRMYSRKFLKTFGKPRLPESELDQRHMDIAASLQALIEEIILKVARHAKELTGAKNICLAGGVALNCVANHKILEETDYEDIFIQPGAGDAGGAIGAALVGYRAHAESYKRIEMKNAYLGPGYPDKDIKRSVINSRLDHKELTREELPAYTARLIAENKVIGWLQGRTEFGPRALCNRSILGNPMNPDMKDILNHRIKHREWFRPFAPVAPEEKAHEYFELHGKTAPFMLLAPEVKKDKQEVLPSITHVDGTARLQTVNRQENELIYDVIAEFEKITGVPVIINTSFNLRGQPIVCSPDEAIETFKRSEMDCLVVGNYVIERGEKEAR